MPGGLREWGSTGACVRIYLPVRTDGGLAADVAADVAADIVAADIVADIVARITAGSRVITQVLSKAFSYRCWRRTCQMRST
ncbi:MAG TPA: hypothetical protein VMX74_10665 [Pirellulales bacterium]|nr:hypothetical protein [Pirellulales bacterium]